MSGAPGPSQAPAALARWGPALLAAALCVVGLGWWPLWADEAWTATMLEAPIGGVIDAIAQDLHPPLFFILARWVTTVFGSSDEAVRAVSAAAAVGAVVIVGRSGMGALDQRQRLVAAFALAIWPFHLVYGVTARPYGMVGLLGAALLWASFELASGHRPRRAAAVLGIVGTLTLYTNYAAGLQLLTAVIAVLAGAPHGERRHRLGMAIGACAVAGILFAPWAVGVMSEQLTAAAPTGGIRAIQPPTYLLWPVGPYFPGAAWLLLVVQVVGLGALIVRRSPLWRPILAWVACAVALPPLLALSHDIGGKAYPFIGFLPCAAVLVGVGTSTLVDWLAPRRLGRLRYLALPVGVLVATQAVPLVHVSSLRSAPFGLPNEGPGTYDIRREVAVIQRVMPGLERLDRTGLGLSGGSYTRYADGVPPTIQPLGEVRPWRTEPRVPGSEYNVTDPLQPSCAFKWAFHRVLHATPLSECQQLAAEVSAQAARDAYSPFLLEAAERAWQRGDVTGAEAWAVRAAAAEPYGCTPTLFLAEVYRLTGRPEAALEALDDVMPTVRRWQRYGVCLELIEDSRAVVLQELGRQPLQADADARRRCLQSKLPGVLCRLGP